MLSWKVASEKHGLRWLGKVSRFFNPSVKSIVGGCFRVAFCHLCACIRLEVENAEILSAICNVAGGIAVVLHRCVEEYLWAGVLFFSQ